MQTSLRSMLCSLCALGLCLLVGQSSLLWADASATIFYLEQLLAEGKKVAILSVDMQTGYTKGFDYPEEFYSVIDEQMKLLDYFAADPRVYFVDINYSNFGPTLTSLRERLKKKVLTYELFEKDHLDVFGNVEAYTEIGDSEISKYLQSHGVNDIHVMGCFEAVCIRNTVEGGLMDNYNVSVDRDMNIINALDGSKKLSRINEEWRYLQEEYPSLTLIIAPPEMPCSLHEQDVSKFDMVE